jgi:hemoglobin
MKRDIAGVEDIKVLVDAFYGRVQQDELLAPIFLEKIRGNWAPHLDTMYRFWNAALFQVREYQGNPFRKHMTLPVKQEHFERWINLFYLTVDEQFAGEKADEAKSRAMIMAHTFYQRMNINTNPHPFPVL